MKECNLYLIGKPESSKYFSKRGGPSINDKCIYKLVDELKKKGIKVNLESSKAIYVDPVSRFNEEEKKGECGIANGKDLKEKYVFLNYSLKAGELEVYLEDVSEKDIEGIHCCLNFEDICDRGKMKALDDIKEVLTRFYKFECKDTK